MLEARVIPVLLVSSGRLVKTTQFKKENYIGDPINTVKIFNEKYVDEIVILDISATREGRGPDYSLIQRLTDEAFMPFAYGGGITRVDEVKKILRMGVEKVVLGTSAFTNPNLITESADRFGSQSVVVSVDVRNNIFGKPKVYVRNGRRNTKVDPLEYAGISASLGAGEIILNNINRDGTFMGYDIDMIKSFTSQLDIPVVAVGGANSPKNLLAAIRDGGASAAAAGSMFVYFGPNKAVLINYPWEDLRIK